MIHNGMRSGAPRGGTTAHLGQERRSPRQETGPLTWGLELSRLSESLFTAANTPFAELRWKGMGEQLEMQTRRGALLQRALTCFYVALGIFVATAIALALVSYSVPVAWVPSALGIAGMLMLFYGCVMLLRETRLALRAVDSEMAFVLELSARHRREAPPR